VLCFLCGTDWIFIHYIGERLLQRVKSNFLTELSKVLHEKLIVAQIVKRFFVFYGIRRLINLYTRGRHWFLSTAKWLHFKLFLPFRLSDQNFACNHSSQVIIIHFMTLYVISNSTHCICRSGFHTEVLVEPHCVPDVVPGGRGSPGCLLGRSDLVPSRQAHSAAFSDSAGTLKRWNVQLQRTCWRGSIFLPCKSLQIL
jgi:hypothetical protein